MPIVYETAAPVGSFGEVARLQAQRAAAAAGGGFGGGGYGRGGGIPYDTGIQDAIQFRDQLQFAQASQAQNSQRGYDLARMQQEGQVQEQREKFQLQANLMNVELTQQENMRLQRMKNAIGDVTNDPSLSAAEKNDYILQLKTGIDPLQHRLAQSKLANETMAKNAMAEQYQAMAALRNQEAEVTAKTAAQRTAFIPDFQALSEITEDIARSANLPDMTPQQRDAVIHQMATAEAQRQGLGVWKFQEGYGKWSDLHGSNAKETGSKSAAAAKGQPSHPSGLDTNGYLKALQQATSQAHHEATQTVTDENGIKKPSRPELQDAVTFNKRVGDIMADVYGLPRNFNDYNKLTPPSEGGGAKRYDRTKASWNSSATSGSTGAPSATGGGATAAATPAGQAPVAFRTADLEKQANFVASAQGVSDDEKTAANFLLKESQKLIEQYPDPAKRPADVQKKLANYADNLDVILKKVKPPQQEPQGQWVPEPDGRSDFRRGVDRVGGYVGKVGGDVRQGVSGLGDAIFGSTIIPRRAGARK